MGGGKGNGGNLLRRRGKSNHLVKSDVVFLCNFYRLRSFTSIH